LLAKHLAHGDQRRLEIARALATEPNLRWTARGGMVRRRPDLALSTASGDGTTIPLIEHDMKPVMSVCDRVLVLDYGKKIAEKRRRR
jgi:ABC-type branched-subunit amino acid transport system ATPase component